MICIRICITINTLHPDPAVARDSHAVCGKLHRFIAFPPLISHRLPRRQHVSELHRITILHIAEILHLIQSVNTHQSRPRITGVASPRNCGRQQSESHQLLTNAAGRNDPMNPSLLSVCFIVYAIFRRNAKCHCRSVCWLWLGSTVMGERVGQGLLIYCMAKHRTCATALCTDTSRQYFTQVHDHSPVLHTVPSTQPLSTIERSPIEHPLQTV